MRARSKRIAIATAALLAAGVATGAAAQPPRPSTPEAPAGVKSCVYLPDLDHTKIVDDRNILFYMRDDTILQNSLPEPCHGLSAKNRFTYGSSSLKRLCAGNMITLLTDLSFGGVAPTNTCKLGTFLPVDEDEVDDLLGAASKGGRRKQAIKSKPVDLAPDTAEAPKAPAETGGAAPQPAPDAPAR